MTSLPKLLLIICLAFCLRLYHLTSPLADWHSWRQADTASVALEYSKHGLDLLHPKYLDLSSIPSGKSNPQGYRMVEFPLIPGLVSSLASIILPHFPTLEIHYLYRFVNLLISLFSLVFLYAIIALFNHPRLALWTAFIYAVLPFNLYYSRTTLPEVALVCFSLAAVYFGLKVIFHPHRSSLLAHTLFASLSLIIKPTAIFYLVVVWYVILRHTTFKQFIRRFLLPFCLASLPLIIWRLWITQYPEGIPANLWLLNGNGIRLKGAWFRWLFADRLSRLILGYWGLIPLGFGFINLLSYNQPVFNLIASLKQLLLRFHHSDSQPPHLSRFIVVWMISLLAYLIIFATGNVQHDYYQYLLIPLIATLIAAGFDYLYSQNNPASCLLASCSLCFMLAFSWYEVRGFYQINHPEIIVAGQTVAQLTPADALVIAPYQGDTAFLYATKRRGWPIGGDIDAKIKAGASYYVTINKNDEYLDLTHDYQTIAETSSFALIKLQ